MRKTIYIAIVNKLKSIVDANEVPIIQYFDFWNQDVDFADEEPFPTPAVFIEFGSIYYKNTKEAKQVADVSIKLHIVTDGSRPTYDGSNTQNTALYFLDLINMINKKMYELAGQSRIASHTNHDHGALMENIEEYKLVGELDVSAYSNNDN